MIDNLADFGRAIGNENGRYFTVKGGYTQATDDSLVRLNRALERVRGDSQPSVSEEALLGSIRIGVHSDVQVTATGWGSTLLRAKDHTVSQVFGSARSL